MHLYDSPLKFPNDCNDWIAIGGCVAGVRQVFVNNSPTTYPLLLTIHTNV